MQKKLTLLNGLLFLGHLASAQTNIVVTQPVSATPGTLNTLVGVRAGMTNTSATTGAGNVFVGAGTGQQNTTGSQNTFLGSNTGAANTTGSDNVMLGAYNALSYFHTGNANVFIGETAGGSNTTGSANTMVGYETGRDNTSGSNNTLFGHRAQNYTQQSSTRNSNNTLAGAGIRSFGEFNTIIGYGAWGGQLYNTSIGVQAGGASFSITATSNVIMGTNAGRSIQSGSANFFLGDNAGGRTTTGGYNVYLGANAGNGTGVNGDNNVAVGFESGRNNRSNTGDTGSTNTFLGFRADVTASSAANLWHNATSLGANTNVSASNAIVLGDSASGVNVGIGTTAPATKLEVVSSLSGTSGLRLTQLTSATSTSLTASKFLTVDASGDVMLASYVSGVRLGVDGKEADALWERNGHFLQSKKDKAVFVGSNVTKTPAGYNLYVSKGILTERLKVAVNNTSEWSDYVFAPNYQLRPLAEVERYVKANRHLPGVPSAQEMVSNGNDLHQTDAILLAKIEELTLYAIEAEQVDKAQQRQIQQLRQENRRIRQQLNIRR